MCTKCVFRLPFLVKKKKKSKDLKKELKKKKKEKKHKKKKARKITESSVSYVNISLTSENLGTVMNRIQLKYDLRRFLKFQKINFWIAATPLVPTIARALFFVKKHFPWLILILVLINFEYQITAFTYIFTTPVMEF